MAVAVIQEEDLGEEILEVDLEADLVEVVAEEVDEAVVVEVEEEHHVKSSHQSESNVRMTFSL